MKRGFILFIGMMLFIAACTSDNAKSDNENIPDELTPTDDAVTPTDTDDVTADEIVTDGIATDDVITDDILTDETGEGGGNDEGTVMPDDDSVVIDPVACCVEIVKEWFRCDGLNADQADACASCVEGLASCTDFLPLDSEWVCAVSCNDICEPGTVVENDDTVGQGTGKTRRAVAEQYCTWMTDTACSYEPADFTGLGSIEPLTACF